MKNTVNPKRVKCERRVYIWVACSSGDCKLLKIQRNGASEHKSTRPLQVIKYGEPLDPLQKDELRTAVEKLRRQMLRKSREYDCQILQERMELLHQAHQVGHEGQRERVFCGSASTVCLFLSGWRNIQRICTNESHSLNPLTFLSNQMHTPPPSDTNGYANQLSIR